MIGHTVAYRSPTVMIWMIPSVSVEAVRGYLGVPPSSFTHHVPQTSGCRAIARESTRQANYGNRLNLVLHLDRGLSNNKQI